VPEDHLGGPRDPARHNNIMSRMIPLFPLGLVVFPGNAVPLHIFEDRYKEMVGEAEAAGTEFGIVLARDGGIVNAGCTVNVESVLQRYPDGRFDVLTRGQRRFAIASLNQDKDYLRGEVEYFDDEDADPPPPALRQRVLHAFEQMRQALANTAENAREDATEYTAEATPDPNNPRLSFQIAQAVKDLDFQSQMQRSRSEAERLQALAGFMGEYVARQQYATKMKHLAPMNGSGRKPAGLQE
jgi:Lon protease-like protein